MTCTGSRLPRRVTAPLILLSLLLISSAQYLIFLVVPNERIMGAVQRIFYFHVGSAIACYGAFGAVLISSIVYLTTRSRAADRWSEAAGEVGFLLCTIVLVTGMIWGHSAWNTWFRWEEPRLVTFLVLWLIFLAFTVLRNFGDPIRIGVHSAVLGIMGASSVPFVSLSINFLNASQQLHPKVVEHGGLKHWSYWVAFGESSVALLVFTALLVVLRYRVATLDETMRMRAGDRELSL